MAFFDNKRVLNRTKHIYKKIVVSVGSGNARQSHKGLKDAREIIQDARDEAFRIKKAAEDESRKVRQESLEIEKRIAQKEESLESKLSQIARLEKELENSKQVFAKRDQEITKNR